MAKSKIKVVPARRFNIVHLIFLLFFVYMIIIVGKYIAKEDIKVFEVTEGSLTQNHNYTGLIFRTEKLMYSEAEGFVKCYVNDGDRISKEGAVFAVDKEGNDSRSADNNAQSTITEEQYRTIRKYLNHFSTNYGGQNYTNVYAFKDQLTTTLYGIEQQEAGELGEDSGLLLQKADASGVVYFTLDGFEGLAADTVTRKSLNSFELSSSRILTGDEVAEKTLVCKIISSETWEIVIPITDADAEYYADKKRASLLLNDIGCSVTADIEVYEDANGEKLAKLTLDEYMSSYAAERLISFQLVKPIKTGLKVPKTSVVSNELFVIPVEYANTSENTASVQFYRKTSENGGIASREAISPEISYVDSEYYYVDDSELQAGDVILMVDEDGTVQNDGYTIGEKKTLEGVYNVNKGYAVFEVVDILDENDSYCIVKSGTRYGLTVYDHIVLNASTVDEDELLY